MDGVLLVDKPPGPTSHDIVAQVRRELGGRRGPKVGHAGTLDPFATGLLLVLVGRATRAQRFLMALPKTYQAVARFGWTSDTGDRDGQLHRTGAAMPDPLVLPTGVLRQRPPAYSAVHVDGERAFRRARRGEEVVTAEREVTVTRFALLWREEDRAGLEVECSTGTYVRSLVSELGDAYCDELRRTAIGDFRVQDADPERLVGLNEALGFLPARHLDADDARRAGHGVAVGAREAPGTGVVRLVDGSGLIALAEPRGGQLKPIVGLREPRSGGASNASGAGEAMNPEDVAE